MRASAAAIGASRLRSAPLMPTRGDQLLGHEVGERQQGREVALGDVLRVLLGDLLDVDAAHVAEDHHRQAREAVPGDADVVLLRDRRARLRPARRAACGR